jgi:hypothetical protein
MVAGGGSTEICIVENKKIIEKHFNDYGSISVVRQFPQINDYHPNLDLAKVDEFCMGKTEDIENQADLLVLAGGDHIFHYQCAGPDFLEENKFYRDTAAPYSVSAENADAKDRRLIFHDDMSDYVAKYKSMSEIWWSGQRSMCCCVRAAAQKCGAKFIIPTKVNMCLGLISELIQE